MSDFPSGAICVVGLAKVANQNPIHSVHRALAGSFIVDPSSGLVYDVQFDTVCQITSDFLASLLIGLSLHTDLEEMISRVQSRYFGDSRRAITVILRDVAGPPEGVPRGRVQLNLSLFMVLEVSPPTAE